MRTAIHVRCEPIQQSQVEIPHGAAPRRARIPTRCHSREGKPAAIQRPPSDRCVAPTTHSIPAFMLPGAAGGWREMDVHVDLRSCVSRRAGGEVAGPTVSNVLRDIHVLARNRPFTSEQMESACVSLIRSFAQSAPAAYLRRRAHRGDAVHEGDFHLAAVKAAGDGVMVRRFIVAQHDFERVSSFQVPLAAILEAVPLWGAPPETSRGGVPGRAVAPRSQRSRPRAMDIRAGHHSE